MITAELARFLTTISHDINRQIGVLITREGAISHVILGDSNSIFIPDLSDYPIGKKPIRGLRLVHTHLKNEPLTEDDLTDLALLRLDYIAAIGVKGGEPDRLYTAHLTPRSVGKLYDTSEVLNFHNFDMDFDGFIRSLDREMQIGREQESGAGAERAILISVSEHRRYEQEESLDELEELAVSGNVHVLDRVTQRTKQINPKYLLGIGKLKELIINALNKGATILIFDQDLTPSQCKEIADLTEMKVIDRSQLILDIFAERAHSRDGKVQVELAQLKYRLPRLMGKGKAMSKLTGGIGGRGPGEMKLEIDRRRVRDKIHQLERDLKKLSLARVQRKQRRVDRGIPIVSIIGYTNAGKSTLLNSLTNSSTFVENRMFATLDTASRKLRFPKEREVIITDTVGFIKDLPKDLMAAFKATLEELEDADLLLHLVDASNERFENQIDSVEGILKELDLEQKPRMLVFNKSDRAPADRVDNLLTRFDSFAISALNPETFTTMLLEMEKKAFSRY